MTIKSLFMSKQGFCTEAQLSKGSNRNLNVTARCTLSYTGSQKKITLRLDKEFNKKTQVL